MHHLGKKESKKEKEPKNKVTKNLLQGDSNPDPPSTLKLKIKRIYPLDHLGGHCFITFKRGIYSLSLVIDSF